ncbi:oligosaccharyl transferase, archaeosortase A system-associated [Halospeciosus flavus]|uniref:dolichyl-phosphooligosaccharide-protein glycotransferase n=1 Tax=Halospeciosus flavus TaxID=3032283 RepID=A0ABD5Z3P6_9EURY|nr:oligosaccharyl transferase, archaeosortase A system-associated [Halospeciosus flavus]
MSDDTEKSGLSLQSGDSFLDLVEEYYHVPVLALVLGFMFWVRARSWENFMVNGQVVFSGNDPWYHYRQVVYTVNHWPKTMPFDPWTGFPTGVSVGQFGTLFDQLIATAALIIGLGNPSQQTIALAVVFAPPVFGTLVAIPTYFIGKRIAGRFGGVTAAVLLAFLPGTFLQRSLAGFADHNIAEPLFQATAVLGILVALTVATRDRPVWEQVADRDFAALRSVIGWSALAGIATALYLWVWPPGVLLLGIFGAYMTVQLVADYYQGRSPDHVAFVGTVSMAVTGVLLLLPLSQSGFSATRFSLLQPFMAFATAIGSVFLAWLARQWDSRDVDRGFYPVAVIGLLALGVVLVRFLAPGLYNLIASNLLRFIGFSAGAEYRTIAEAQPFLSLAERYRQVTRAGAIALYYGLTFFTAALAGAIMLWSPLLRSSSPRKVGVGAVSIVVIGVIAMFTGILPAIAGFLGIDSTFLGLLLVGGLLFVSLLLADISAEKRMLLVWAVFITAAAFTQIRFNYYLAVPVAVFNGYLVMRVFHFVDFGETTDQVKDVEWSQVIAVVLVFLIILVPLAGAFQIGGAPVSNVVQSSSGNNPGSGIQGWDPMLDWMQNNTPAEGTYGGANNADKMDYYGTYQKPADGDFDYPKGAYGVMSWWDYGHWITVEGERIPVANPFQQHATFAANYLLAPNETAANNVLQQHGGPQEQTRYVAVDWQMVTLGSKFGAPTVFYNANESISRSDFYTPIYQQQNQSITRQLGNLRSQRYYQSQMVRLYRYHGSAVQPQPIVVDWDQTRTTETGFTYRVYQQDGQNDSLYKTNFRSMQEARSFVQNDSTSQIGGVGRYPSEYVPALNHYRLVGLSTQQAPTAQIFRGERLSNLPMWAKTFERVPGAKIHGTAPANTTVTASVTMQALQLGPNATFEYTQRAQTGPDGEFTMTLPYSTTGYENWGTAKGYTNVSVRATGPYQFSAGRSLNISSGEIYTYTTNASVTEAHVIGENTSTIQVDLEKQTVGQIGTGQSGSDSGNTSSSGALVTNETTTDDTDSDSTDTSETTTSSPATYDYEPTLARAD